jgi:2-polyprenyl-3-methyl-5-hydroxy-6-metoxy-1,4-benzoquinol methylase
MLNADMVWNNGERQAATSLSGIRADHVARYRFACAYVQKGMRVIDAACGIGYGSKMLAEAGAEVAGFDISPDAIAWGAQHYAHENVALQVADCLALPVAPNSVPLFVSFETVEHVPDAPFLAEVLRVLAPGGRFIASTPNQDLMPFHPGFQHHLRHYTPAELADLIEGAGFKIEARASNVDRESARIVPGWDGLFNIVVARKAA